MTVFDGLVAEADTAAGRLSGEVDDALGLCIFRGIPYADPRVGPARFGPPPPLTAWSGTRSAQRFGPAAIQATRVPGGPLAAAFGVPDGEESEDCLTLNVWTPGCDEGSRPVLVWVHGGAFRMGSSSAPAYDGSLLAERGDAVVVTLNYRLGILGFLACEELGTANAGLADQIAALEWVQREIRAFGGDPERVTVLGESAGAKSIECLLAAPSARGLFHGAILQSTYDTPMEPEDGYDHARRLAAHLGFGPDEMHRLKEVPAERLMAADAEVVAAAGPPQIGSGGSGPVIDGQLLPTSPVHAIRQGAAVSVPTIIGTTLDEARLFAALDPSGSGLDEAAASRRLLELLDAHPDDNALAEQAAEAYRAEREARGRDTSPDDLVVDAMTDRMFRQHSIRLAEALSGHSTDTWMYLFTWESPAAGGRLGACHAIDIAFAFGTASAMGELVGDGTEGLTETVQDLWLTLAHDGAPSSPTIGEWPPYQTTGRATLELGESPTVLDAPADAVRMIWQ